MVTVAVMAVVVARNAVVKRGASHLAGCDTNSDPDAISKVQKQAGFIQPAFFLCSS